MDQLASQALSERFGCPQYYFSQVMLSLEKMLLRMLILMGMLLIPILRMHLQLILRMSFTVRMMMRPIMSLYRNVLIVLRLTRSRVMIVLTR